MLEILFSILVVSGLAMWYDIWRLRKQKRKYNRSTIESKLRIIELGGF